MELDSALSNLGYFDDPAQTTPAFNPCRQAPCPACGVVNGDGVLTWVSIMPTPKDHPKRCYFYAHHVECKGDPKIREFEDRVVGEMFEWESAPH